MRQVLPLLFFFVACDRDAQYEVKSLASSVSQTWAECDPSTVTRLQEDLGVQFIESFEPCHSNNFTLSSWSTDGVHLYFQLAFSAHVLNGQTKALHALPSDNGMPKGEPVWLDATQFVVAMQDEDDQINLTKFQLPSSPDGNLKAVSSVPIDLEEPRFSQLDGATHLLITGLNDDDERRVYRVDLNSGAVTPAMEWVEGSIESFTYDAASGTVFLGQNGNVTGHNRDTGEKTFAFANATRAVLHPLGTLVAIESTGDPISTYTPRYKGELTDAMIRREKVRRAEWEEEKPDWIPESITPPAIDLWDVENERRVRFFQIHGENFEWYPGNPYYLSFHLWGLGDQKLNTNILLSDLPARLKVIEPGEELDPGMILVQGKND
jgi:hypothetical protein